MRDRALAAAMASLVLQLLGSSSARAVEFPVSAYAASLDTPPELVDPLSLLFRMPQRAALTESQIFVFTGSSDEALGAIGNTHGQGFFLLAQPHVNPPGSTFHAGWGGNLSALRLGLAGRASRRQEESLRMTTREAEFSGDYEGAERTLWEGSIGLGVGRERFEVDATIDATRLDAKESFVFLEANQPYADTTLVYLESDDDWSYGGAAALRARFGGDVELCAAGFWNRLETTYTGIDYIQSDLSAIEVERCYERWSAGLCAAFPAGMFDWLAVSGRWLSTETEQWDRSAADYRLETFEQGQLSLALRQNMWRDLWGHAGVAVAYTRSKNHYEEINFDGGLWRRDEGSERFSQDFSCGASYSWRNIDLRAAVRETLPLADLFFALDVIVRP